MNRPHRPSRLVIERPTPHPEPDLSVRATVDLGAIRHNVEVLQDRAGTADLMAVVKADAYGHGAEQVAQVLSAEGVRHFAVARPAEGASLRTAGLDGRILVLGAPLPSQLSTYTAHNLDLTVPSAEVAEAASAHGTAGRPLRAHLKVDTGMGRIGLSPAEAPAVASRLRSASGVTLAGVWTHFATADEPGSSFAQTQMDRFEALLDTLDVPAERVHAANTGALLTIGERAARPAGITPSLVRTGISLYGLAARPELGARLDLRPALRLTARVTHLKTVSAGTPISYGSRWRAPRTVRIATIGAGYGDGYPRLGSGRAVVRLGGEERPVVGTICMDMCMVNLGPPGRAPATEVSVGDEALLFGPEGPTVYDVADWAETIPYEICCGISPRVPRQYTDAPEETAAGAAPPAVASPPSSS